MPEVCFVLSKLSFGVTVLACFINVACINFKD